MVVVDVLPGLPINERELIGSQSDNLSVLLMKFFGPMSQVTFEKGVGIRDAGNGP